MTNPDLEVLRVELTHATAIFTTRRGGVSQAPYDSLNLGSHVGDDDANVSRNLELLREHTNLQSIRTVRQVHGSELLDCDETAPSPRSEADGMITSQLDVGLLITVADCYPVALATPTRIAMLHCGWRPLAAGIVEKTLALLAPEPIEAAIGPGIGAAAYEVGDEVVDAFGDDARDHIHDGHLDLAAVLRTKLSGLRRVESTGGCTFSDRERFYSYRRDGGVTGRQGGLVWRT